MFDIELLVETSTVILAVLLAPRKSQEHTASSNAPVGHGAMLLLIIYG